MPEPFRFSSGQLAHSVKDLIGVCHQSPQDVIYYLKRGDFENWLAYIGETEIAQKVGKVRQSSVSDEEKLQQFLKILQPPEPEIVTSTSEKEETASPSNTPISSSSETSETPDVTETTPISSSSETSETPDITETTPISSSSETSETPDVTEATPISSSSETSEISDVTEATPITEDTSETTDVTEATANTTQTTEKTTKVAITEDKSSTETTSSVTKETETQEVEVTPLAPPNEYSDEMPTPNSPFAKAVKDFIRRYIGNH